jgi:hypothetical protein
MDHTTFLYSKEQAGRQLVFLPPILTELEQPVLLFVDGPPIAPSLHFLPTLRTPNIHSWDDLVYSQRAAEHSQLSETAVLTVRHAEAARSTGAAALRRQFLHRKRALPVRRVQDRLHGRRLGEAAVWWAVVPPGWTEPDAARECVCILAQVVV